MWFPTRSDINQPVQSQKRARSLKFRIKVEEELYYLSSENKGADQLRGYREADRRLCFRICRLLVFSHGGSNTCVLYSNLHPLYLLTQCGVLFLLAEIDNNIILRIYKITCTS